MERCPFAGRLRVPQTACQKKNTREGGRLAVSGIFDQALIHSIIFNKCHARLWPAGPHKTGSGWTDLGLTVVYGGKRQTGQKSCHEEQSQQGRRFRVENLRPVGTEGGKGATPLQARNAVELCIGLSGLNPEPEASSARIPLNLAKVSLPIPSLCDQQEQLMMFLCIFTASNGRA